MSQKSLYSLSLTWSFLRKKGYKMVEKYELLVRTRQSKHCGFSIYIFDNSKSIMKKVKINGHVGQAKKMVLCGLVFARKIARMNM